MPRINVPPTRSNLIRIKKELQFAREGYEILDRKREVLTTELIRVAHEAEVLQKEVWKAAGRSLPRYGKGSTDHGARSRGMGGPGCQQDGGRAAQIPRDHGRAHPVIEASGGPPEMLYSLGDTTAALDEASAAFREVLVRIPELSMLVTTVWRLANELRKTQRRVNALQHIFIPEYEETVAFIVSSLEEREREETFRLKLLKNRSKKAQKRQRSLLLSRHSRAPVENRAAGR